MRIRRLAAAIAVAAALSALTAPALIEREEINTETTATSPLHRGYHPCDQGCSGHWFR